MNQPLYLKILDVTPSTEARDTSRSVMLIGFQRHSNLGIGYLAANLRRWGYQAEVFDFETDRRQILEAAKVMNPVLIGFSLIFRLISPGSAR